MAITVKPSQIYRGMDKLKIESFLKEHNHKIIDFRMCEPGDLALFYNSDKLAIGRARVLWAGFPRFIVENKDETGVEDFWE